MPDRTDVIIVHLEHLREGVDALNARLDLLNGRTRASETKIAVLEARAEDAKAVGGRQGGINGAAWGAILSAIIAGLAQAFGGSK